MKKFYARNYNLIVIISWCVFLVLLWVQYMHLSTWEEATMMLSVLLPIICISIFVTNAWLPKALHRKRLAVFIVQFFAATILMAFLIALGYQMVRWAEQAGYFPHSLLLADDNTLLVDFLFAIPSTLVINFGFCGLRFVYEHFELQKAHLETQLQVLQSQINPHFMFNILNHIHILMQTNVELASSLLMQYADILRYQLYSGKSDTVRLEQEVQFVKNFIEIEKVRWGNTVKVSCVWEVEDANKQIPPFLLITFVENAFKHVSRSLPENYINIHFLQHKDEICLDVENSKTGAPRKSEGSGLGLENIKNRLEILYHKDYKLSIDNTDTVYRSKLEIWQM